MEKRILGVRTEVNRQLEIISEVNDWKYQMICLFSLLDSFAQDIADYPTYKSRDAFCEFVAKYDNTFPYWNEIDTVSFFYKHGDLFVGYDPTGFMTDGAVYYCGEIIKRQSQDLFRYVEMDEHISELNKHRYKMLFYILRNKLVHELNTPNGIMGTAKDENPFYISFSIITDKEQKDTWALTFPCGFVKRVVSSSIDNYLDYCLKENKEPFENSDLLRDHFVTWVE